MGKYKGSKPKIRNNPVGLPSMKETLIQECERLDGDGDGAFVPNLIDQLRSHVVEERDSGLNSLSIACQNPRLMEELLEADVVSIASPLLVDPSAMVRHSAAGSLRNLSISGPVICELMVAQDVITPLTELFKKYYALGWQPKKTKDGKIDTVTETFIQAVNLLWNLCESSDVALKRFNKEGLADIIIKSLNLEVYGIRVCIPVAQLFHAVTEENLEIASKMEYLEKIFEGIVSAEMEGDIEAKYLQTLAVGVLLNLKGGSISGIPLEHVATFFRVLAVSLNLDHVESIGRLVQREGFLTSSAEKDEGKAVGESGRGDGEGSMETSVSVEDEIQAVKNLLNAQILSMSIFSNLICSDEDAEEYSDDESLESVTDFSGGVEDTPMECDDTGALRLLPEIRDVIISNNLGGILRSKLRPIDTSAVDALKKHSSGAKILRLLVQLRSTALLCFQNLVGFLEISELGGVEETEVIFASATITLAEEASGDTSGESTQNLIEAVTSLQRAIMQKWTDANVTKPFNWFRPETLNVFVEVYQKLNVAKIHTNIIKIIGSFGILLSKIERTSENEKLVKGPLSQVGEFLLHCVLEPFDREHLPVAAEALDTIFDVFAEDDYNDVLKELEIIEKLKKFLPSYKKFIQSQRKQLAEHNAIIQTSKTNLSRFITYKLQNGCT